MQRCDPRYNNMVSVNRCFILARNCKVSVTDCSIQSGIIGGWGWLTGAERMPPPGIQAQRPRTRTARTTRQINGAILFGG